jgi:hypothetical protein
VTRRRSASVALIAVALLAGSCTGAGSSATERSAAIANTSPTTAGGGALHLPSVTPGGAPTLRAAISKLCIPATTPAGTPAAGELPPDLTTIAHEVEQARGHDFVTLPKAEAVSAQEMDRRLEESFKSYYPKDLYDRRTFAWRTIGVIPPDANLYDAYRAFLTGGVVGFYDPDTGELVYQGSGDQGFTERLTLAHELTHALDDQIFNLKRLDTLTNTCQDERFAGALGLVEGSAQYFSAAAAAENPSVNLGDLLAAIAQAVGSGGAPDGVPPFLYAINIWPYSAGMSFVGTLAGQGGTQAVDRAFEHLPVSSEQVMHPQLYPSDKPVPVDIPNLTAALGPSWGDLDAMTIGEEWLRAMLALRLDGDTADAAAAGWGGGAYRAFSDGTDVVVVLRTAWDTSPDAVAFADALQRWGSANHVTPTVLRHGNQVTAVFATSARSRDAAAGAL